jgi:hypothetical protein
MPTERTVAAECSPMCKLLDAPARKRQMPSICICGRGAVCGYTPLSDESLDGIEKFLAGKATSINANTARAMLDEIKWLRAQLADADAFRSRTKEMT